MVLLDITFQVADGRHRDTKPASNQGRNLRENVKFCTESVRMRIRT